MPAAHSFGTIPQQPESETFTDVVMRPRRCYRARSNLRWLPFAAELSQPMAVTELTADCADGSVLVQRWWSQ
jgi:hypothetical protein